jgi:hypothetical protein
MSKANGSFAGPWRTSQSARTLYWWDQRGLDRAAGELRQLFETWSAAWGVGEVTARCHGSVSATAATTMWVRFGAAGSELAWLTQEREEAELLPALFSGAGPFGPLSRAVAQACRQDLHGRLAKLLGVSASTGASTPPGYLAHAGSGVLEARLSGPLQGCLRIAPEAAARWRVSSRHPVVRNAPPLVPATTALAMRPVALDVQLEGCELEVGVLQGLQVGDIVCLEHALERPASVRHADATLCGAFLGRRQGHMAVELALGAP